MKFHELEDGEEFKYGDSVYEKDSVPEEVQGIIENAICLEDYTGAMFEPDDEVKRVD